MKKKQTIVRCEQHAGLIADLKYLSDIAEANKSLPGVSFTFEIEEDGHNYKLHHKNFNNRLPCILGFLQEELDRMGDDYLTKLVWKEDQGFVGEMFCRLSSDDADASYNTIIRLKTFDGRMVRMFLLCSPSQRYPGGNLKQIRGIGLIIEDESYIRPKMYSCLSEDIKPEDAEKINSVSNREWDVAKCILDGLIPKEIAVKLFIDIETVNTHIKNFRSKLGIKKNAGLIGFAFQTGLYFWLKTRP